MHGNPAEQKGSQMTKVNLMEALQRSLQHNPHNLTAALEALVDAHSVRAVLCDLAAICWEKAQHLRVNWQDEVSAKAFERAASICTQAQIKIEDAGLAV